MAKDQNVANLVCGGVAGSVSKTLLAPLERIKVVLQTQNLVASKGFIPYGGVASGLKRMVSEQGVVSLWRGNGANVLRVFPTTAIRFTSFERFKVLLAGENGQLTYARQILAGSLCGATATVMTYPLDLARVRLTMDLSSSGKKVHTGIADCLLKTVRSEGPSAVYKGLGVSLLEIMPYAGISFGTYERLKLHIPEESGWWKVGAGVVSGGCASLAAYPIDTVRRRLMLNASPGFADRYHGALHCVMTVAREEGLSALYKGCLLNLLKSAPGAGITFVTFDKLGALYKTRP